ncbi:MAG: aminoacyl-tRNA hydrolase [Candidatus Komeilibacteria bacterium]|nr:aminoacyl-tRNA hydrolase [Candidatus Komeilibacteria bacterium]
MKIIVGLGNPGMKYTKTRHNLGWLALDAFADRLTSGKWHKNPRFNSYIIEDTYDDDKLILSKPLTFMNNSGLALGALKNYYHCTNQDILVVYDDLDLPFGSIRLGKFDSAGGHNGIKSIITFLRGSDFDRLRVGIKPPAELIMPAEKFVLQKFSKDEKKILPDILNTTTEAISLYLEQGLDKAMNRYN